MDGAAGMEGAAGSGGSTGGAAGQGGSTGVGQECTPDDGCDDGELCRNGFCTPPLVLTAEVELSPVEAGELGRVSFVVSNASETNAAEDVAVTVPIPEGTSSLFANRLSAGGQCTSPTFCGFGESVSWAMGTMAPGQSRRVWLSPSALEEAEGTTLEFEATATSTNGLAANQIARLGVVSGRLVDVRVETSRSPVTPGSALTYTVYYGNRSGALMDGVTLELDVGTRAEVLDSGGGTESRGRITWDLGRLEKDEGGTRHATVDVVVPDGLQAEGSATLRNERAMEGDTATADANVAVEMAPLVAAVEVTPDPAGPQALTYVAVTVANPSNGSAADNVRIEVQVPSGADFVSRDRSSPGATCDGSPFCGAGRNLSWDVGTLEPGDSRVVWLQPFIDFSAPRGSLVRFQADVRAGAPTRADGVDETPTIAGGTVLVADPVVSLSAIESADPVEGGEALSYVLHYGNPTGVSALDAELVFVPPEQSVVIEADGGQTEDGRVVWGIGSLDPAGVLGPAEGGARRVKVRVDDAAEAVLRAETSIRTAGLPSGAARARPVTAVGPSTLRATVEANPDPNTDGELGVVSFTVSNPSSTTIADGVELRAIVPDGVAPITSNLTSFGGTCESGSTCQLGHAVSWQIGQLRPGESRVVSFEPVVDSSTAPGAVLHYRADVRVNAALDEAESETVLAAAAALARERALDLRVVESQNPIGAGDSLTYTLYYSNRSIDNVENAILRFRSDPRTAVTGPGGGTVDGGEVTWMLGQLVPGASGSRQVGVSSSSANGEQLEAIARLFDGDDELEETRATVVTPVENDTLVTRLIADAGSAAQETQFRVAAVVTNGSAVDTESDVVVEIQLPDGIELMDAGDIAPGGTCSRAGPLCGRGDTLSFVVPSLGPLESTGQDLIWFEPTVDDQQVPGFLMYVEAQTIVGTIPRNVAGTAVAVEAAPP